MKVLFYSHYFRPSVGGVERVVESLAQGFAERGHQVTVATATPATGADDAGLPYRVVRQPGAFTLSRLVLRHEVTHLAGPALMPMFLAWLLRRPTVIEHHVYQAVCPNGLLLLPSTLEVCPGHFQAGEHRQCRLCNRNLGRLASWRLWLTAFPRLWLSRSASANVAITGHVQRRLRLPHSRVIYYGVSPAPAKENTGGPGAAHAAPVCFAYVGRLVREKGLPLLIEAAARLKNEGHSFRLRFIGDGPERAGLESAARASGLEDRICFTGMLGGEDLRRATADVAALVMPSIWEETAGMAAIEQMNRGRAVIASDIGGLGEIVDGTGLKFPPSDAAALAACMRRIIENTELVRELGEKAQRRTLGLFGIERRIDEHEQLCDAILKGMS